MQTIRKQILFYNFYFCYLLKCKLNILLILKKIVKIEKNYVNKLYNLYITNPLNM